VSNPWLSIPLTDYEGHMGSAVVQQLSALSELFKQVVERCRPTSVAILGVAGGNGLEHLSATSVRRVVGVDINSQYLDETRRRFGGRAALELHCVDLAKDELHLEPVELVHAALVFEHAGVERALDNALGLVAHGGRLSVVLQLPSADVESVAPTQYASMRTLAHHFSLIDVDTFHGLLARRNFRLADVHVQHLPGEKAFWMGEFSSR
jgi:Zn-dependent alcohol dehydrogenase